MQVNVIPENGKITDEMIIQVGDIVLCRVIRVMFGQIIAEIFCVGDSMLHSNSPKATIRKEDVRPSDIDSVVMSDCFRPGDIVRADVLSLGDARHYFLSTSKSHLGVVR
jgi:exosome complex component CSL4